MYEAVGVHVENIIRVNFGLAVLINLIILITLKTDDCDGAENCSNNKNLSLLKFLFGAMQGVISTLVLVFLLIKRAPLKFKNHWHTFYQNGTTPPPAPVTLPVLSRPSVHVDFAHPALSPLYRSLHLTRCTHTLHSHAALTHCTHTLYSHTVPLAALY
jgi:hypothetical protein